MIFDYTQFTAKKCNKALKQNISIDDGDVKHSTACSTTKNVLKNNSKTKFLKHINNKLYKYGTKLTKGGYPIYVWFKGLSCMYGQIQTQGNFESLSLYQKYCSLFSLYACWLQ